MSVTKDARRLEPLGWSRAASQLLLKLTQKHLLHPQRAPDLKTPWQGPDGDAPLQANQANQATHRSFPTRFGPGPWPRPRQRPGTSQRRQSASWHPDSARLTDSLAADLLCLEAKWTSRALEGRRGKAFQDVLPLEAPLASTPGCPDTLTGAERLQAAGGEAPGRGLEGAPREGAAVPIPEGPLPVGIDGGPSVGGRPSRTPLRSGGPESAGLSTRGGWGHGLAHAMGVGATGRPPIELAPR